MKKLIFILACIIFCNICIVGQVETRYYPDGGALENIKQLQKRTKSSTLKSMPSFDKQKLIDEDKKMEGSDVPFQFGKGFDINMKLDEGQWMNTANGRIWSATFYSPGAYSINFVFDDFYLAKGAELYIVNEEGTMLYGPVVHENNTTSGYFLTDLIQGDNVTVYLFEPTASIGNSRLTIKRVVHGYKDVFSEEKSLRSTNQHYDVMCYPEWSKEADAVVRLLTNMGTAFCSGSMLMTTDKSFKPYILTAFHCYDIGLSTGATLSPAEIAEAERTLFQFQYRRVNCNSSTILNSRSFNGATFRAGWQNTDFTLLEINHDLRNDPTLTWLGWDIGGAIPQTGTTIHHPGGQVMKITKDNHRLTSNGRVIDWNDGTQSPANSHWTAVFDLGYTEGGSSGAPLFDSYKRVIGQLHGGEGNTKHFGKLSQSYNGGGSSNTRLRDWLNPTNLGTFTTSLRFIEGIEIKNSVDNICKNNTLTYSLNIPDNMPVTWQAVENMTLVSGQGTKTATFSGKTSGYGKVSATVTYNNRQYTFENNKVNVLPGTPTVPYGRIEVSGAGYDNKVPVGTRVLIKVAGGTYGLGITEYDWKLYEWQRYIKGYYSENGIEKEGVYIELPAYDAPPIAKIVATPWNDCGQGAYILSNLEIENSGYYKSAADNPNPVEVKVYSFNSGKLVHHEKAAIGFNIRNTTLEDGIYIVETTDSEGNVTRDKVMKNK